MSTIIPTGFDNVTILRGSKYKGVWEWDNCDFAGLTATVKIKNIHSQFSDVKNTYEVGTVIIEPLDADGNPYKGRILVELSKEDTILFAIPDDEEFSYDEQSGYYSVMNVTLSDGTVILSANVKAIDSLEAETIDVLLDNRQEAVIINAKLNELLTAKDEFFTALTTATNLANSIVNDKNIVANDKSIVEAIKADITAMKNQVETIFDNFDDRFLGVKYSDPTTDNDGNGLLVGAIYYNGTAKEIRFYNGASWDRPIASAQTYAFQALNSKTSAEDFKNQTESFKNTASTKADEASASASSALASKNASATSEQNALSYKNQAENYKNTAQSSAYSATNSETNALSYKSEAENFKDLIMSKIQIAIDRANEATSSALLAEQFAQTAYSYTNGALAISGSIIDLGSLTDTANYFNTDLGVIA